MASERYTEQLVLNSMKIVLGKNDFGFVYEQGQTQNIPKLHDALVRAGGKPSYCDINNYNSGGNGKAQPEYIITLNSSRDTIIVIECKGSVKKHSSELYCRPKDFSVDGVLYYSKYLKDEYNVIAIAVSGTTIENSVVSTFYWKKGSENFEEIKKARDILYTPESYLNILSGKKIARDISVKDIRETALEMHDLLRNVKMSERHKPLFIAGILIALEDDDFTNEYDKLSSVNSIISSLSRAIENTLDKSDIPPSKIRDIIKAFSIIKNNEKLKNLPLDNKGSILWFINQLEMKIKPMMNYSEQTFDSLGIFYHEFVKYSGGDGKGLGIVLTPQHITEFMCEIARVNKNSRVVDITCGSGSFLVTAMSKMFKEANETEIAKIKKNNLYGVEIDFELYTLAIANMIVRKDGKSNIIHGDCFSQKNIDTLKGKSINIGLMNPPYSQKDVSELEFVEKMLDILTINGKGVAIVPVSCAIGTKFKELRKRIMKKHTLDAVFSMPDDVFYPTGTNTCIMLWTAHSPHINLADNKAKNKTFFGYFKNDGFVKKKKLGRIDYNNNWNDTLKQWLSLFNDKSIVPGQTAYEYVIDSDEWLAEAYIETDYSELSESDFQNTVNDYLAFLIKSGEFND